MHKPDPAAVFSAALSLWEACRGDAEIDHLLGLSEAYNGHDQLMWEVMRIGLLFEEWSCVHVAFEELTDVWPYLLGDQFGTACLKRYGTESMAYFEQSDCLFVAMELRLPVLLSDILPVPIDMRVSNPWPDSAFREYRIQSMRREVGENQDVTAFLLGDDPGDENYRYPFFSLHGVGENGLSEWIADRPTCAASIQLLKNLVPGIKLPPKPWLVRLEAISKGAGTGFEGVAGSAHGLDRAAMGCS